jgi:peptidoglycan hydrolase-like protein with peptidoglycan-binding domain
MFTMYRQPTFSSATLLKPMAGIATAALLIGWAAGVGAQSTNPPLPPLPPAKQGDTTQNNAPSSAQAPAAPQTQAALPVSNLPGLPLGHDDVREVQNQLIALGFDPGAADGEAGPATVAAAQRYDQSRGGSGRVSMDSALLARLKADTAPRLTYDQVEARSQARSPARYQAEAPASASAANQFGGIVQQLAPLIGAAISSSNNGNYGGGYGYGGYPGPGYYGPGPVYGGYRYGGY